MAGLVFGGQVTGPLVQVMESEANVSDHPISRLQVEILPILRLSPRTGEGIGYELVLKNDSYDEIVSSSIEVRGKVVVGAAAQIYRVAFEVLLDSTIADSESTTQPETIRGTIYDTSDQDWGVRCEGKFNYEMNTAAGHKIWECSLSLPCMVRVAPKGRTVLRVTFRRNTKRKIDEFRRGETPAYYQGGVIFEEHTLTVKLESGGVLSAPIDQDFLSFVANWDS